MKQRIAFTRSTAIALDAIGFCAFITEIECRFRQPGLWTTDGLISTNFFSRCCLSGGKRQHWQRKDCLFLHIGVDHPCYMGNGTLVEVWDQVNSKFSGWENESKHKCRFYGWRCVIFFAVGWPRSSHPLKSGSSDPSRKHTSATRHKIVGPEFMSVYNAMFQYDQILF